MRAMEDDLELIDDDLTLMEDDLGVMEDDLELMEDAPGTRKLEKTARKHLGNIKKLPFDIWLRNIHPRSYILR